MDKQGKCQQINENALEASYRVSKRIAKAKSPHTIGEELIMPCAKEMVSLMIGEYMVSKLGIIPLSNNTVHRRICDMSEDITAQNIAAIKESPWHAIQLDESTDIASCEQLIVWVRFIKDGDFVDEPLLCKSLETTTKGEDIFTKIDAFYNKEGLDFNKLIGSTTDGAPAMLGKHSGCKYISDTLHDPPGSGGCSYNARKPDERFFSGDKNRKSHQIECSKHEVIQIVL